WLNNPHRKGEDDMGRVYGVQGRSWQKPDGTTLDQLKKIVDNLSKGIDDRGEILTFYNPGEFELGCLRPCMHTHTFSLLGDTLYLTSYQRSCDVPLGLNFNQIQCFVLLALMAQITGYKAGKAYHKIVNAHIYENQLELMRDVQLKREPFPEPKLHINPDIKSLEDIETWVSTNDFSIEGYECHEPIKYPFAV
ncbi:MAG: thymidylate synthase, partial [Pseudomonadota bacterium]|nr:thymidylate synthase [Pseudomonadota bacterium]